VTAARDVTRRRPARQSGSRGRQVHRAGPNDKFSRRSGPRTAARRRPPVVEPAAGACDTPGVPLRLCEQAEPVAAADGGRMLVSGSSLSLGAAAAAELGR
jgi:hypothetical protein